MPELLSKMALQGREDGRRELLRNAEHPFRRRSTPDLFTKRGATVYVRERPSKKQITVSVHRSHRFVLSQRTGNTNRAGLEGVYVRRASVGAAARDSKGEIGTPAATSTDRRASRGTWGGLRLPTYRTGSAFRLFVVAAVEALTGRR